jgi:hypothetical protein
MVISHWYYWYLIVISPGETLIPGSLGDGLRHPLQGAVKNGDGRYLEMVMLIYFHREH